MAARPVTLQTVPELLEISLELPEENLALDEELFLEADRRALAGEPTAFLRIWESPRWFVALGVASRLEEDVDRGRCAEEGIAVLRRITGGGTVLQGPGCLNVTFVLPLTAGADLRTVEGSYRAIAGRVAQALGVEVRGGSDLAIGDRKCAGSAQKRNARVLLHQMSVLYRFDLPRIPRYLREPKRRPAYRGGRTHLEFLVNLPLEAAEIAGRIGGAFSARRASTRPPEIRVETLERYRSPSWTERF